jgi:sortase A
MRGVLEPGPSARRTAHRRGDRRRRVLRGLSTVLVVAGTLVLVDAGMTVAWQEPVTAVMTHFRQGELRDDLAQLRAAGPTPLELRALASLHDDRRRIAFLARSLRRRTVNGDAIGRLSIPSIGVDQIVVKGSQPGDLHQGPGFYDDTALPGMPGTSAIAGHRTTYGAPFRHLDGVKPGDAIRVEMPYAAFTYRVERARIVEPTALWVIRRARYDRLVLSACHPLFSAAQRLVVFARLERVVPARQHALQATPTIDAAWTRVGVSGRTRQQPA